MPTDTSALAHALLDANAYLTLATAEVDGTPWVSPVSFAYDDEAVRLLWVSRPGTRHSRNIAWRPEIAAVVFDSTVPVGQADALYLTARARVLDGADRETGIARFSTRSVGHGAGPWTREDVTGGTELLLYGADVVGAWVLERGVDRRLEVRLS